MADGTCPYCGGEMPAQRPKVKPRKFCSDLCARRGAASNRLVTVPCVACGTPVQRKIRHTQDRAPVCSNVCRSAYMTEWVKENPRMSKLPDDHAVHWILGQRSSPLRFFDCADCGTLVCYDERQSSAKRCRTCRILKAASQRFISAECRCCGVWFVMDRQQMSHLSSGDTYCSQRCARKMHRRKRDARRRAAYVESVSPAYVYRRDGFTCQICHKRLAMTKRAPHPKSPSVDHIIPLAKGGTHENANVQAAHLLCNALKSDGAAADQLLLVG